MPLLIQFPIMIGLYGVIYTPLTNVLRIASTKVETLTAAFKTFAETAGITYQEHSVEITMLKHFDDFKAAVSSVTSTLTGDELKSIIDFNNKFNIFGINLSDTPSFKVFDALWNGEGRSADEIIEQRGLKQITDTGAIEALIDEVLAANAAMVEEFRSGKEKAFNALVGQAMKATKGKANPQQVNALLRQKLGQP